MEHRVHEALQVKKDGKNVENVDGGRHNLKDMVMLDAIRRLPQMFLSGLYFNASLRERSQCY